MQKLQTQWNHKWGKHKRLKKLKNDVAKQNCNKTKLASNRNTSLNATEYSKFFFCSQTKLILLM